MNINFIIDENKKIYTAFDEENNTDNYLCSFIFTSEDWVCQEKYVIFWNKKGKSVIISLGDKQEVTCPLPNIIKDKIFYIQIYASDELSTIKKKIKLNREIWRNDNECNDDICWSERKNLLREKQQVINKVEYKENKILIYSKNKLIDVIDVLDDSLMQKILDGVAPKFIVDKVLSKDSTHPLANKTIYKALLKVPKTSELPAVALSGDYNDLKNIPTEFNPKHHNHVVVDVIDYEENIDTDLNTLLGILADEISKE